MAAARRILERRNFYHADHCGALDFRFRGNDTGKLASTGPISPKRAPGLNLCRVGQDNVMHLNAPKMPVYSNEPTLRTFRDQELEGVERLQGFAR